MKSQLFFMDRLFKVGGLIAGGSLAFKIVEYNNPTKLMAVGNSIGKFMESNTNLTSSIMTIALGGIVCGALKIMDNERPTILHNRKAIIEDKVTDVIIIVGTVGIIAVIAKNLLFV